MYGIVAETGGCSKGSTLICSIRDSYNVKDELATVNIEFRLLDGEWFRKSMQPSSRFLMNLLLSGLLSFGRSNVCAQSLLWSLHMRHRPANSDGFVEKCRINVAKKVSTAPCFRFDVSLAAAAQCRFFTGATLRALDCWLTEFWSLLSHPSN